MTEKHSPPNRPVLACFTNAWRVAIQISEATGVDMSVERTDDPDRPFVVKPRSANDNDAVAAIR